MAKEKANWVAGGQALVRIQFVDPPRECFRDTAEYVKSRRARSAYPREPARTNTKFMLPGVLAVKLESVCDFCRTVFI